MAITLVLINPNDPISSGPAVLNDNFTTIKSHIDDLENLLNPANNTIKLTDLTTVPANSAEMEAITLTKVTGNAIVIDPNGGGVTFTVGVNGAVTGLKVVMSGTGADASDFQDVNINGSFAMNGEMDVDNIVRFTGANAQVAMKYGTVSVVDANTGGAATIPVDVSKQYEVNMDYDNSATPLANNGEVNLDTTNFEDGQIFIFRCFKENASGMRFWNGTAGNEVFAYIDPNAGAGYVQIADTVKPTFTPAASPANRSWMKCQWRDIGAGTFRLVVLESENVTNVN